MLHVLVIDAYELNEHDVAALTNCTSLRSLEIRASKITCSLAPL